MLAQVAVPAATLILFLPVPRGFAYLAAPVVAISNHAETSVKYPALTDPPDHTDILQIIQILPIVHTVSRLICADHSDHTDSTQVDTDLADQ